MEQLLRLREAGGTEALTELIKSGLLNPDSGTSGILGGLVIAGAVISLVIALLQCFFGYKMLRFWVALIGFIIGFAVGAGIIGSVMEEPSGVLVVLVGVTAGALLGILAFKLYLAGVFLYCGLLGAVLVSFLPFPDAGAMQTVRLVLMAVVFITAGVLSVRFQRTFVIAITAISGGLGAAGALGRLVPELSEDPKKAAAAGVVLIILGLGIQLLTTGDRRKTVGKKR